MKIRAHLLALSVLLAACGGGSKAANCTEYAAEVQEMLASTTTAKQIQDFLNDTESDVAELILESRDSPDAELCANAVLEATFTMADRGFAEIN